jgi:GT2 family glycosyltransferase
LVNWRSWRDTLLSLETLFGSDYPAFDAVVVDNNSGDDSINRICSWAQGRELVSVPPELLGLVKLRLQPALNSFVVVNESDVREMPTQRASLTLICAGRNGGFAAGNNLGLEYLRRIGGYNYYWLLNNDAFPAPKALSFLVARAVKDPALGQIGATLIFSQRPDTVQALGGAVYEPKTGRAYHLGSETAVARLKDVSQSEIETRMSYVIGASILVSERFLAQVGLMEESYFLYFEELDWSLRGKAEFALGYARDALIYHRAGGSTQTRSRRSVLAAYYLARNRVAVTRRYFPAYISTVVVGLATETLRYAARGRWSEAIGFYRALRESMWFACIGGRH